MQIRLHAGVSFQTSSTRVSASARRPPRRSGSGRTAIDQNSSGFGRDRSRGRLTCRPFPERRLEGGSFEAASTIRTKRCPPPVTRQPCASKSAGRPMTRRLWHRREFLRLGIAIGGGAGHERFSLDPSSRRGLGGRRGAPRDHCRRNNAPRRAAASRQHPVTRTSSASPSRCH